MFLLKKINSVPVSIPSFLVPWLYFYILLQNYDGFEKTALFTADWNNISGELFFIFFFFFIFHEIFYFLQNLYFS